MIPRKTLPQRFGGEQPGSCIVCRRHASAMGYAPSNRFQALVWACDDIECIRATRKIYHMSTTTLNRMERSAMRDAIDVAGPYLDGLGTTDLAQLSEEQMDEFLERLMLGFEEAMKRRASAYEAPF